MAEVNLKRKSKTSQRNYGLSPEQIEELRAAYRQTKQLPNPYNRGPYFYFIEALKQLGISKAHPYVKVKEKMRKIMSDTETKDAKGATAWDRFFHKAGCERDPDGRIIQNAQVLQRTKDYGLKLLQLGKVVGSKGVVIDIQRNGNDFTYKLNTNSNTPMKPSRQKAKAKASK
jgi:hypothetical protein